MNIYTVRDNLKNTIKGKELLLADWESRPNANDPNLAAVQKFLAVNIEELKRILEDIEACCQLASEASWVLHPERMGR